MKKLKLKFIEWIFNKGLKPFEQVVIAQKVLASKANIPEVKKQFEKAFGVHKFNRTVEQWKNLVRVYGLETVCKIENMKPEEVEAKMMKFSDRIKSEFKKRPEVSKLKVAPPPPSKVKK
jgi:ferritin-like metal-binding protein YciE